LTGAAQSDGEIRYSSPDMQYYGGGIWNSMNVSDSGVSCGGSIGEIRLNTAPAPDRVEFCSTSNWRRMDYETMTEGCGTPGEIDWYMQRSVIRYCDGANWVKTAVGTPYVDYYLTEGSSWVVPQDWNDTENTIEVIGGGGGGELAGGGGGAYSKIINVDLTPGTVLGYQAGSGGTSTNNGGDSWLCSGTSNCASIGGSAVIVGAKGGTGAIDEVGALGGQASSGIGDVKYSGGTGGWYALGSGNSGGGGGGAGGPFGNGGHAAHGIGNDMGSGGGAGGGGSNGSDTGTGGNNYLGLGGGPVCGAGTNGGGGGGCDYGMPGQGGPGREWGGRGSGGGGGGWGELSPAGADGGLYGGGAGGFGTGGPGIVHIRYTPGTDGNPREFDFTDVWNASLSTVYYSAALMTEFTTNPLTVNVSGGDAQVAKNGNGTWGSSVNVAPGDTLNIRMTSSASSNTDITATVTVGTQTVTWLVTTKTLQYNYFVATSSGTNGALGGRSGADATCLTNLQANNWRGKSNAVLDSSTVKAFLCDSTGCNNLTANKTFSFARSNSPTEGGATFTVTGTGTGPGNTHNWNNVNRFGASSTINFWTGRASLSSSFWNVTADTNHCSDWTSTSAVVNGRSGTSNSSNANRWTNATLSTCDQSRRLICAVEYTPGLDVTPDAFDFTDIPYADFNTLYETSAPMLGFTGSITGSVTGGGAEIRVNSTGSWVTSGLSILPGDILNLRMTSANAYDTPSTANVTVGGVAADWTMNSPTPPVFDFVDVYGASLSTTYYTSHLLTGYGIDPLAVSVSGGGAEVAKNGNGSWASSVNLSPGDTLNLRMTSSGSASTALTATVSYASHNVDWVVSTAAATEFHYFVMTSTAMSSGNLGGLSGANAACLADLQANNWLGKSNVQLDHSTVKAFLCDGTSCNNLQASKTYAFALSGSGTVGGSTMNITSTGTGPGNATAWNTLGYFGTATNNYWTGRASLSSTFFNVTADSNHCNNWTSSLNSYSGRRGVNSSATANRWASSATICEDTSRRLLCAVDYSTAVDQVPAQFDFTDVSFASESTQYSDSAVITGFIGPATGSVSGGGAEIRANNTGSWVTSGLTLYPGDTLNVRMTTGTGSFTVTSTNVTVGASTVDWRITNQDYQTTIYLTSVGQSTWTVPGNWNDSDNSIEVIGGGGGGRVAPNSVDGSGGAGGGGYSKVTNLDLTPGGSVFYQVGAGGVSGAAGGDTYFNELDSSGATCDSNVTTGQSVCAKGGGGPSAVSAAGGAGGAAASGVGTLKYSGGDGGAGAGGSADHLGAGGGGAAGPFGNGGTGGIPQEDGNCKGGGGGGNGGGSIGGNGALSGNGIDGAYGGNNYLGTGGGQTSQNGTDGGGGGGCSTSGDAGQGGAGIEWGTRGSGGGGGGRGEWCEVNLVRSGGLYGGGGGGAGNGPGAQGIIVIRYRP